ncbi:MAG: ATP-binding protein [Solobacterium sp.]|jgi:predicted AAA+ superfamily ATPase|nr:ATP-binding protein [Solobacterium sp.]
MIYKKRITDRILQDKLMAKGAVVIEGPKWCGKTTTALQFAKSVIRMDDPKNRDSFLQMSEMDPQFLLKGETPRLIDEWQTAPKLWDAARYEIDTRGKEGQFILTGSAVPCESEQITHSGTGRFTWLTMRTMSLYESGESTGEVSLQELFDQTEKIQGVNPLNIETLAFLICRGGWPHAVGMSEKPALEQAFDYYDAVVRNDINRVDHINKDPERVKRLMRSYARNQNGQVANTLLKKDMLENEDASLNEDTVSSYVEALKKIYIVEDMPAWNPNLRSKTAIRAADTRYFIDSSIGIAALGIGPGDLLQELNTMGLMFETMCVRDLRVYAEALGGELLHYRDRTGLECDTVIHLRNGSYGLAEIKLGGDRLIEEGVRNLMKLKDKIDTSKMKAPSFLMIVIGAGEYAYRRKDGVYIVPIGCLKD